MSVESLLGFAQRAGRLAKGFDATLRAVEQGNARLLVITPDASPRVVRRMTKAAEAADTPILVWGSKGALGKAVGSRDLGVLAVCDDGFAKAIQDKVTDESGPSKERFR